MNQKNKGFAGILVTSVSPKHFQGLIGKVRNYLLEILKYVQEVQI